MRLSNVAWTDLFVGGERAPLQVIRVTLANQGPGAVSKGTLVTVRIEGAGVTTPEPVRVHDLEPAAERVVEVPVAVDPAYAEDTSRPVTVIAETEQARFSAPADIVVAAPGWTMLMVSHFHYDPVWWNTQGGFTEAWYDIPEAERIRPPELRTAFDLVRAHLAAARNDPDYKFVLAEVDYLKPHWDACPEDRADLRQLIAEGRVEIVGGNYNEPNTNLTCSESTIRNAVYGIGFQRDVVGGDPRSAWMLDVFGHDPSYPGLMADAGLTSSAWARGPFHQWGPKGTVGDNRRMQFPSEFEWISPSGRGLLTSYMPNHYGAGWALQSLKTLEQAEAEAYRLFCDLKTVAATRFTMLPVGTDHVIPSRWCTEIHRDWNKRYLWPRFLVGLPSEFFAAVREDAVERRIRFTPQSRDMNPVYTGKDVSYIDTKQAQRAAEVAVLEGERLATLAALLGGRFPAEALDKAWRQLLFNAHHDGITGTESDQVYLDLLGGWREAYELGDAVRTAAIDHLGARVDTAALAGRAQGWPALVVNTLSWPRDGLTRLPLTFPQGGPAGVQLTDDRGAPVPALAEGVRRHPDGSLAELTLTFLARDIPALGYRGYLAVPADTVPGGWEPAQGPAISNETFQVEADPERGGALTRIFDKRAGRELLRSGAAGNELVLYEEYPAHPRWSEGPWHLLPKGPGRGSAGVRALVRAERCPVGARLWSTWNFDTELRVTQEVLLWDGVELLDFRTHVDGSIGQDRLLRVRFPLDIAGALPLYEVANAVVGRPFGFPNSDSAEHLWTLDNPAATWFGLGSTARVALTEEAGAAPRALLAVGVAEVVAPDSDPGAPDAHHEAVRALVARLAGRGVTATCTRPDGQRYGSLDADSNLPDVRIALGGPDRNAFVARVLADADPAYGRWLRDELASHGTASVWVPAARPREQAWVPGADLRGVRDLPVLIVAGTDLGAAAATVAADRDDPALLCTVVQPATLDGAAAPLEDYAVALLNRGTPSSVAEVDGTVSVSLMRSCSGWPAGIWLDVPRRTVPDGSSFAWQHWSHTYRYALVAGGGDWRRAGFVSAGQAFNHGLRARAVGVHTGDLPASASLLEVQPAEVVLTALKPRGNPLASGRPGEVDLSGAGLTVRCFESSGRPRRVEIRCFTGLAGATTTDLLEERDRGAVPVQDDALTFEIGAADTMTVAALPLNLRGGGGKGGEDDPLDPHDPLDPYEPLDSFGPLDPLDPLDPHGALDPHGPLGPRTERAGPVFTRYWLHNKGAAPMGYLPVSVHVSPTRLVLAAAAAREGKKLSPSAPREGEDPGAAREGEDPGAPREGSGPAAAFRVTVACGATAATGRVELLVPPEFAAEPAADLAYDLAPGEHAAFDIAVRARPDVAFGGYFLAARITDELGQKLEDVVALTVGDAGPERAEPLAVTLETSAVNLAPGEHGEVLVRLDNRARSQVRGEAQLLSPYGTWEMLTPWTQGFAVGPAATHTLRCRVRAPATARPGSHSWALVKVMYFGRLAHTEAVPITIVPG
jgi:alpha-mannosidase